MTFHSVEFVPGIQQIKSEQKSPSAKETLFTNVLV